LTDIKRHVAIIGMGCRLPGGIESPNQLWEFLINKGNAISSCPKERWDQNIHYNLNPLNPSTHHVKEAGFLDDVGSFDASFFGVSPREATCMDPQQRLLMEVSWRAIENAGIRIDEIKGTKTGVFIGISSCDYGMLLWGSEYDYLVPENETFLLSGNTGCIAANRLSYFLDLRGPSLTVDTACSSSLVAIDLACQSINSGKCDMAIVGGVQIIVHPGIHTSFCKAGLLSPSGQCKTFDDDADGYVRGEAAGVVILKSYEKALEDGDIIDAIICGSAVNSDGRSSGISAPRLDTQILCIESAYKDAALDSSKTDYIEAHGTGTKQGDPIELEALGIALALKTECLVGSVKANLGHSETASGITGLIKAVLVAKNKEVPAAINLKNPNTKINLELYKLKIPLETTKIGLEGSPVQIGVSSFGFGGTNAHVVLVSAEDNSKKISPDIISKTIIHTSKDCRRCSKNIGRYRRGSKN
jgi:acyl transferase domain-containing protein